MYFRNVFAYYDEQLFKGIFFLSFSIRNVSNTININIQFNERYNLRENYNNNLFYYVRKKKLLNCFKIFQFLKKWI